MKPVRHIILLILSILLFYSCSRREEAVVLPELAEADSLMYVSPDSALQLLRQMPPPSSSQPLQQATWALLLTQARYKCFVEQADSRLSILIKLHLPSAQIASLLGVSTDSVYKSKNRLKERILRTCEPWKPEYSLDTWLWDF